MVPADDLDQHVEALVERLASHAPLTMWAAKSHPCVQPPSLVPGGPEIGLFNDPEGHMIGLVKSAPQD